MKEYIERGALLKDKQWLALQSYDKARTISIIVGQPTADVVEVRHGEWESDWGSYYPWCSECGEQPRSGYMEKYCPNCGAKMDGKGEGE